MKKKHPEEKSDKKVFDFTEEDEKKELSGSEEDGREGEYKVTLGSPVLSI